MTEKEANIRLEKSPLKLFEEKLKESKDLNAHLGAVESNEVKKGN